VAPNNVSPRVIPNYDAVANQAIRNLPGGGKVFAGQREDPFFVDLGQTFDDINFRPDVGTGNQGNGKDDLAGYNVHSIVLEMPASVLTGQTGTSVLGAYASTSRPHVTVRGRGHGRYDQVQRLANPLVNEAIIGTPDKDEWNATDPEDERQFEDYYLNPRLALALQVVYGIPAGTNGRTDLRDLLLKYQPNDRRLSELLRLDLGVPPTPLATQRRLTVLAGDPAGWPNGRRPKDDVTDIAIRVVGGANYIAARAADGVNTNDATLSSSFPFLASPFDGRNRQHANR